MQLGGDSKKRPEQIWDETSDRFYFEDLCFMSQKIGDAQFCSTKWQILSNHFIRVLIAEKWPLKI